MKVVVIDHEDSFVYNLRQAFAGLGHSVATLRYTVPRGDVARERPDALVLSPGPGHPSDRRVTGLARELVAESAGRVPILGVCLGHQLLGELYGARVVRAADPVHGVAGPVTHEGTGVFAGIPSPFAGARYHSLIIDRATVASPLAITASAEDGTPMAIRHLRDPTVGVQFHPESYLTEAGTKLLENFLAEAKR
ncbi:MAG TPA: aminodeoxychorismate/anthranilate synthase component II [Thermoplasmata archaeon]|nr:aminodeoxychorismate/anthranilate synthase component II [Thermoplasmata archaeon]